MKIWILTSETPLFNPGGIARYVDNFAKYLSRQGHSVTVFGRDDEERSCEVSPGYRYVSVVPKWDKCQLESNSNKPDEHPSWPYNCLDYWGAYSYQMADVVEGLAQKEGIPDVIESQEYCAVPYYLFQRKLTGQDSYVLKDVPIVVNAHSPDFIIRKYNEEPVFNMPHYWTGRLERFCMLAADSVICPSAYLSRQIEAEFAGKLRVKHLPLPWTDPKQFEELELHREGVGDVLYFGRLEVRKGVINLLKRCERMWQSGKRFKLRMAGGDTHYFPRNMSVRDWIEKTYAHRIAEELIILEGGLSQEDLMGRIKAAGFIVIPSTWENWPNTCIESMALGKVVVGSIHGGQAEMIGEDEKCGFLFSWDDPDSFDLAFNQALELDESEKEEMADSARLRIAQWCAPEKTIRDRLEHFDEVIEQKEEHKIFPFVNSHLREGFTRKQLSESEESGKVSIVIPYFNLGETLEETLGSALKVEWPNKEIILVNDGSTDPKSCEVLEEVRKKEHSSVRIIDQPNTGLASARNTGVEAATGEFVLLLDADDLLERSFIQRAMQVLDRYENVHIVYTWERYIEASDDIYPSWNFEFPYLLGHNMTCPICLFYRQAYVAVGGSKEEMAFNFEDFELWINMVKNGFGGVSIPEPLCNYRIRKNSMWQGSSRDQHLHLQNLIAQFHPELYNEYGGELFCLQNANGPAQKWIKPSDNSPFDEYEDWSRRRIKNLEKETKHWWKKCNSTAKMLESANVEKQSLWEEKNHLQAQLNQLTESHEKK